MSQTSTGWMTVAGSWMDACHGPAGDASRELPVPRGGDRPHPLDDSARRRAESDKIRSGDAVPRAGTLDPYAVAHAFPDRWRRYLHANFRHPIAVAKAFECSEKTARQWWDGTNGVNARWVAVAMRLHPAIAHDMLFAAE